MRTREICAQLCKDAQAAGLIDPITQLPPRDEVTLSALLCLYHQAGRIRWDRVPLLRPTCEGSGLTADSLFGRAGLMCSEYPLFHQTEAESQARGGMRPDILLMDQERQWAIFVEAKVGAGGKDDSFGGQLGRYAKVLMESDIPELFLVVLTSAKFIRRTSPWYANELKSAVRRYSPNGRLKAYVILWEDVINAIDPKAPLGCGT